MRFVLKYAILLNFPAFIEYKPPQRIASLNLIDKVGFAMFLGIANCAPQDGLLLHYK